MTFDEWYSIWLASGHIEQRGCKKGQFVMARLNDIGSYEIGNVAIITTEQNHSDASPRMIGLKKTEEHKAKLRKSRLGKTHSAETKAKIGFAQKGKLKGPLKEETKQKLRMLNLGKKGTPHTVEARAKISAAKKKFWELKKLGSVSCS